jgi:hypothetical protein
MNAPDGPRARLAVLLEAVARQRDASCARAGMEASTEATALLAAARREARERLRAAARTKRERVRARCREVEVAREGDLRLRRLALLQRLLAMSWRALPAALAARWQAPATRRAWWRAALAVSARLLRSGDWRIVCAPLPAAEHSELESEARRLGARTVQLRIDAACAAGLAVTADGATLDATATGLVRARPAVDAGLAQQLAAALATAVE